MIKLNTYNSHLNRFKQISNKANTQKSHKLSIYETIYMHMTNRNPVNLLNQTMNLNIDANRQDEENFSKCK